MTLKGFTQCPDFIAAPRLRPQYDLDLLFRREDLLKAREVAVGLGYEAIESTRKLPIDHLPAMVRKTGWEWRGDYFDPELPLSLELHFRLWDEKTERIAVQGLDGFWERRVARTLDGLSFVGFDTPDALGYACLHLIRHLLRGDVRASHVYELAWFLEHYAEDEAFWGRWAELHHGSLKRLQAICFQFAREWFRCQLGETASGEVDALPPAVRGWLDSYSWSPLSTLFEPNKDELWLHLALLDSTSAKWSILRRRLLPLSLPGPVDAVHLPANHVTARIRIRSTWRYLKFLTSRVPHHALALIRFLLNPLGMPYWRFFLAAEFYDLGLFIFFLLYNLYLLQLGFKEQFLGLISSAMVVGNLTGSVPAAMAIQRFGLRNVLLAGFTLMALVSAARVLWVFPPALLFLAFAAGMTGSIWATAVPPAVAGLTTERARPLGFSLIFSCGIATGILGGLVGGLLPGWLTRFHVASPHRAALLVGCGTVLFGLWPLSGLRVAQAASGSRTFARPTSRLLQFLIAGAVWNLGTGAFNPFFSAFFAARHLQTEQIGFVFSASQFGQALAVLLAPLALRRFSLAGSISISQMGVAAALLFLAAAVSPAAAAIGYCGYMMLQFATEPALYTLLMDAVPESQRGSASALNLLVASASQALASALAGMMVERLGYGPVMATAAMICVIAGLLFRRLPGPSAAEKG